MTTKKHFSIEKMARTKPFTRPSPAPKSIPTLPTASSTSSSSDTQPLSSFQSPADAVRQSFASPRDAEELQMQLGSGLISNLGNGEEDDVEQIEDEDLGEEDTDDGFFLVANCPACWIARIGPHCGLFRTHAKTE